MTPPHPQNVEEPSSEPSWITVFNGSDRDWRLISMYELRKLEYAINEPCVGKTERCPPGHLEELHDCGNEVIDKVRSRPRVSHTAASEQEIRKDVLALTKAFIKFNHPASLDGLTCKRILEFIEREELRRQPQEQPHRPAQEG